MFLLVNLIVINKFKPMIFIKKISKIKEFNNWLACFSKQLFERKYCLPSESLMTVYAKVA
jgi:hypothetical protein